MSNTVCLRIDRLQKRFGGLVAVEDLNLSIESGLILALVGPNGAGKTTVFNLVTGVLKPDVGEVAWEGQRITGEAPWQVARRGIARSFQDLQLFERMTVYDNVLSAMEPDSWSALDFAAGRRRKERVLEILEEVGLARLARSRAIDLSYAERKFLSLARIIAVDARLWLLDEPASGLDPNSYSRFVKLLRGQVARGRTICIIEHNLDIVIEVSDKIAFLDRGKLLANGPAKDVLRDPNLAALYFGDRVQ